MPGESSSSDQLRDLIKQAVSESLREGDVLCREELRDLMHDACVDAMSTLGIDARNPLDFQRDMQFIRELRLTSEKIRNKAVLTIVSILVAAVLGAMWLGIKSLLHHP
jgi:hypothetical protein